MKKSAAAPSSDCRMATRIWGRLPRIAVRSLKQLIQNHRLSVTSGDISLVEGKWYVTHSGLLRLAARSRCYAINVQPVARFCDPASIRWVFRATVYKTRNSKGFVGYGDADPSNTSPLVRGAEMRVAETRAVNRALRKAYGIGICSVEELSYLSSRPEPTSRSHDVRPHSNGNGSGSGATLRDRLCLLIREHGLDPSLVKRYAADFCGTQELRDASRELVESFVKHVSEWAANDHEALICKLNSYGRTQEVQQ